MVFIFYNIATDSFLQDKWRLYSFSTLALQCYIASQYINFQTLWQTAVLKEVTGFMSMEFTRPMIFQNTGKHVTIHIYIIC